MIKKQIINQYNVALNSMLKKEILDQIEKLYKVDIPKNLLENELKSIPNNSNSNKNENIKSAEKRIKLGLILNEYGEKNNLKVTDDEVRAEIQKQIKGMPGQEKMVLDYYQKNPSATQSLKGSLYEEKIIELIKSKIKLASKEINSEEAEKIISEFNKQDYKEVTKNKSNSSEKNKSKSKKISKK